MLHNWDVGLLEFPKRRVRFGFANYDWTPLLFGVK
jgi:hypothetical protein